MTSESERIKEGTQLRDEAESHFQAERYEESRECFERLIKEYSDLITAGQWEMWVGACSYWLGEFDAAATQLLEAYEITDRENAQPFFVHTLAYLGNVYEAKNEPREALRYLEEAEQYYHLWEGEEYWASRVEFRLLKGRILVTLSEFRRALVEFESIKPENPRKHWSVGQETLFAYEIGRTHHYLGDNEQTCALLYSIDPEQFDDKDLVPGYHYIMARFGISVREYESTLKHIEVLNGFDVSQRRQAEVLCYAGIAHMHLGHKDDAIECFKASQRSPGNYNELREANAKYLARLLKD